jgi:hypothetical protein
LILYNMFLGLASITFIPPFQGFDKSFDDNSIARHRTVPTLL